MTTKLLRSIDDAQAGFATVAASEVGADATGTAASAVAALSSVYQPLDSDLTAIAALTTTAFGRALLALADPADNTKFLNGTGAFSTPAGGSGLTSPQVLARGLGA